MNLIPKQIWKSTYHYYSDQPMDILKADIQQLLDQKEGWTFSVNLKGEFTSEYEFNMTPKWQLANINSYERKISYLEGQIFQDESENTRVDLTIRPNSVLAIFFFLFPFIGFFILISDEGKNGHVIGGLVFTLIVPLLMLLFGHFAKSGIKDTFVRAFDLKQLD